MFVLQVEDAGRSHSKRSKQKNDCSVRALAKVAEISYDEAYDLVARNAGRKSGHGVKTKAWKKFIENTIINGYRFKWIAFQAEKGKSRINCKTFSESPEAKRAIVRNPGHFYACIDGITFDDSNEFNPNKCVYGCWIAEKV